MPATERPAREGRRSSRALAPWRFMGKGILRAVRGAAGIVRPHRGKRGAAPQLASLTVALPPGVGADAFYPPGSAERGASAVEFQRWLREQDEATAAASAQSLVAAGASRPPARSAFPFSLRRLAAYTAAGKGVPPAPGDAHSYAAPHAHADAHHHDHHKRSSAGHGGVAHAAHGGSSEQQLLTVGSRLWDHVLLGAGLLKVGCLACAGTALA